MTFRQKNVPDGLRQSSFVKSKYEKFSDLAAVKNEPKRTQNEANLSPAQGWGLADDVPSKKRAGWLTPKLFCKK